MKDVRIDPSWKEALSPEFEQPYWHALTEFIRSEYMKSPVYPPASELFAAFDLCPIDKVKVVIVGQDPYHGKGQAMGLSFSVRTGVALPPSLQNIFKEIKNDIGITPLQNGNLTRWAKQGVCLLNSVLTVCANNPASHANKGWEQFTDAVIHTLNEKYTNIVYLLWGKYAQAKGAVIDTNNNLVLTSGHPSPYSAHLFFGNHHFSQCNTYLISHNKTPIDWR